MTTGVLIGLIWIMFIHWFADFVFQTNYMAQNKSSKIEALVLHIAVYMIVLFIGTLMFLSDPYYLSLQKITNFVIVNGIFHFVIDFFTSKATSKLWKEGKIHEFFVVIGFDQLLHFIILFGTANIFLFLS